MKRDAVVEKERVKSPPISKPYKNGKKPKSETHQESLHLLNFLSTLNKHITGQTDNNNMTAIEYAEELHSYYESILACIPNNIYWLDRNCVLLGGNDNLAKMFGLKSRSALVGLTYEEMSKLANWTEGQGEVFKQAEIEVMTTGVSRFNVEEPPLMIDGQIRYYISSKVPLYNAKHEIIGVVGISTDITERKQSEIALKNAKEKAEAANKAKTAFLENMRHDIRTPLTGITGFANIIAEEVDDPKIKEYAHDLSTSSDALLDLLNEILEVTKVNSGELPLLKKKFDLKKRLNEVVLLNQAKARQKNINLILDYDKKIPPYVIGDPTRIHRIALELVANALNFIHTGSVKLTVKLSETKKHKLIVKITVEDTGIGIAPEEQQEIFLQFKRLTPSYKGLYKGAGLGLTIVKQFIDELEGEIYVESKVGTGSKFTCIIPLKKPLLSEKFGSEDTTSIIPPIDRIHDAILPIQMADGTSQTASDGTQSRILVVEDHPLASLVVSRLLSTMNCYVEVAPKGKIGVQLVKKNNYDLIFMDIGLPDIDGYEVTKRIRLYELSTGINVPIIALTAHIDEENKQRCLSVGMNAVLSKPLEKAKAEEILNTYIPYRLQTQESLIKLTSASGIDPLNIEGKIIDLDHAKEKFGEKVDVIHSLLAMFVESFPEEVAQLDAAHKKEDWASIQALAHKLKGGSSYCSTMRLKEVCLKLEISIKKNNLELANRIYQQLLVEIKMIEDIVKDKSYLN